MILPLMTTAGTYQFRVRAIPKDTEETAYITSSDWVYSDELDIDADEVCTLSGGAVGGPDKADALTPSQLGWIKDDEAGGTGTQTAPIPSVHGRTLTAGGISLISADIC